MRLHAIPDSGPRRFYLMIKPDGPIALLIDRLRIAHGFSRAYARDRLHITLLPFWNMRDPTPAFLAQLSRAIASLSFDPFRVALNAFGLPIPRYAFRPHVSLAYHGPPPARTAIQPIGWLVESLVLIESVHNERRHILHREWPLTTRQQALHL